MMMPPLRFVALLILIVLTTLGTLFVSVATLQAAPPAIDPTPAPSLFLPLVFGGRSACALNLSEQAILTKMQNDANQQRASVTCHPILASVARSRALDMGTRAYFDHVNPDGYGPNYLVRQAGYVLPSYYDTSPGGNNIESLAAGGSSADETWTDWMNSIAHKTHLLGMDPFFAAQTDVGIGYAYVPGSPYGYYWVVITAYRGP